MKAKVIETGEIINVSYYCCEYAEYDCNSQLKALYNEDELEFEPGPKMVSLDKVCEWIKNNAHKYIYFDEGNTEWYDHDECIENLKKEFE